MRYFAAFTAALLFAFMIVSAPAFSQADDHAQGSQRNDKDKDKDNSSRHAADQDQTRRDDKDTRRDNDQRPADPDARQNENRPNNDRDARQNENRPNVDRRGNHDDARPSGAYHGQQNGGYAQRNGQRPVQERGRRIPEDRFRASFGREHHFHVDRDRIYNQQQPVIVYGGYSFQLVDVWPADWAYTDDCYIDYDDVADQYYLYDAYHPGLRIAVIVIE